MNNLQKIDSLIAEKVMGWNLKKIWPDLLVWENIEGEDRAADEATERYSVYEGFRPSTEISDAWEVVEKLKEKFGEVRITVDYSYLCEVVGWINLEEVIVVAEHRDYAFPYTVCLAALKAEGVDINEYE